MCSPPASPDGSEGGGPAYPPSEDVGSVLEALGLGPVGSRENGNPRVTGSSRGEDDRAGEPSGSHGEALCRMNRALYYRKC